MLEKIIQSMLHGKTEGIDHAVARRKIKLSDAARQCGAASERSYCRSAVPQLLAGLAVQSVENGARRTARPLRRGHLTVVNTKLSARGYKDHAVDDRRRQRRDQIGRSPGWLQRQRAVLLD